MPRAEASASANTIAVQQDWKDREFLTSVQLGVSQLSAFLNDFGARARRGREGGRRVRCRTAFRAAFFC